MDSSTWVALGAMVIGGGLLWGLSSKEERKRGFWYVLLQKQKLEQKQDRDRVMICPHCATKGSVSTRSVDRKKGVSGGKATAALLTSGVSLLATGLSRKEKATAASCSSCGAHWDF